jgi:hypothetical protein
MRRQRHHRLVTVVLIVGLAAACGPDRVIAEGPAGAPDEPDGIDAPAPVPGDLGLPVAGVDEFDFTATMPMVGTLIAGDTGCWRLQNAWDGALFVLPPGTAPGGSDTELITADGELLRAGQAVDVSAAMVGTDALPGGPDGGWATHVDRCAPDSQAIVVGQVLRATEPAMDATDEQGLIERLAATTFDTHWPCGYGFAVSDVDQLVGLYVQPTSPGPPAAGTVTLPDERFEVTVVIGRHLFANHCDDVLEWFEPEPQPSVTWPVTAGGFDYRPGEDTGMCTGTGPVAARLTDAVVTTPSMALELPPIDLRNDAFGCFAG